MALEGQSGGDSLLWFGLQSGKGTPINTAPVATAPADYAPDTVTGEGSIFQARFPFTELGLDLGSEQAESGSIVGRSAASKRVGGQLWSEGPIEVEIIPNQIFHFLRPIFNNKPTDPTAIAVASSAKSTAPPGAATGYNRFTKPAKLSFTGLGSNTTAFVHGFRRIGLPDDEVRPLIEEITVASGAGSTENYFDSWTQVTDADGTEIAAAAIATSGGTVTDTFTSGMAGFGSGLSDGVTTLMRKGFMPVYASDVWFNNTVITLGDDLRMRIEGLGTKIFNRRAPGSTDFDLRAIPDEWLDDTNYPVPDLDFMPSWGGVFQFAGRDVEITGLTLGVNLNLEQRRSSKRGSRFRGRPRRSGTPRQVTCGPTVYFEYEDDSAEVFEDWQDTYIDNAVRQIDFNMYNWLDNGKEYAIKCSMPANQLIEAPGIVVDSDADIERTLSFLSIPTSSSPSNEMSIIVEGDHYKV